VRLKRLLLWFFPQSSVIQDGSVECRLGTGMAALASFILLGILLLALFNPLTIGEMPFWVLLSLVAFLALMGVVLGIVGLCRGRLLWGIAVVFLNLALPPLMVMLMRLVFILVDILLNRLH
jgi:hypothetical protein